jgi:hypothetical protein
VCLLLLVVPFIETLDEARIAADMLRVAGIDGAIDTRSTSVTESEKEASAGAYAFDAIELSAADAATAADTHVIGTLDSRPPSPVTPIENADHVKIPLRNIRGEVVAYSIVSSCDAAAVNKHSWSLTGIKKNYVHAGITSRDEKGISFTKWVQLHYFIVERMGVKPPSTKHTTIDHVSGGGGLNNTRENLRWATRNVQGHNKAKAEGCAGQYRGVFPSPVTKGVWCVQIRRDSRYVSASFRSEQAAAWWYNQQAIAEHQDHASNLNPVEKPDNYDAMLIVGSKWAEPAMRGIKQDGKRFILKLDTKRYYFDTLEAAQKRRDNDKATKAKAKRDALDALPIIRNPDGFAYHVASNNPNLQILLEDDDWRAFQGVNLTANLRKRKVADDQYYVSFKDGQLHRVLMGLTTTDTAVVDHLNSSGLDNRRSNLRITTQAANVQNSNSLPHSSDFKGVSLNCGKWVANISFNKRTQRIGTFPTPEIAGYAYKQRALELYGPHARFRPVDTPEGWTWRDSKLTRDE